MPSPFPGMNPYLEHEDAWHTFHKHFIPRVAEQVEGQVRPDYIVKLGEHVYVHKLLDPPVEPDFPAVDIERLAFVEIRDRRSREVVTVVELLSPSNKRTGRDREQYLGKRGQILASSANLVEIDLLRGGEPLLPTNQPECDYSVMVSRAEQRSTVEFWPIGLRERLPVIPVPLRRPDPDACLDLQDILHRIYDTAGCEDYIYEGAPDPPLSPEDAAWAGPFVPPSR